jgi:hypothetical protein
MDQGLRDYGTTEKTKAEIGKAESRNEPKADHGTTGLRDYGLW